MAGATGAPLFGGGSGFDGVVLLRPLPRGAVLQVARGRSAQVCPGPSGCAVQLQRRLKTADAGGRCALAGLPRPSIRLQGIVGRCGCRCHSLCACCRCAHAGVFGATRGRPGCRRHCVCCRSHTRVLGAAASSQAGCRGTPPREDDPSVRGLHSGLPQEGATHGPLDLSFAPMLAAPPLGLRQRSQTDQASPRRRSRLPR